MSKKTIKAICLFLTLILHSANSPAYMISAHYVRFWGLTYLAIQSFNYGNPSQSLWTLYDGFMPFQSALQFPIFFLLNGVLIPQITLPGSSSGTFTSVGSLSGILISPGLHLMTTFQPQQLTFEVLTSFYFTGAGATTSTGSGTGLSVIPE